MHDAFMRAKADGENIRRRAQEDVAKAHKFAVESFAEAMVPVRTAWKWPSRSKPRRSNRSRKASK
jgi:molecular chaperone GrpE (heat shock protein)